ncbi:MAG: Hint domain-containing protein, partial [Patescibacteria group bacterium]
MIQADGNVGIGTTTPGSLLSVHGNALISGNLASVANITATGTITHTAFPYTSLTASTEYPDVNFNLARSVQFSSGSIATQRAFIIQAPTYSFTASSTLTDASTLAITGAPVAGTLATTTNTYGLRIAAGSVRGSGAIAPRNAYGLFVDAPTGAADNYTAVFNTGNVGIGTSPPNPVLTVSASTTVAAASTSVLALISRGDNVNAAANIGAGLEFRAMNTASSTATSSSIVGLLSTVTAGSEAGDLAFYTRTGGASLQERVRITSLGNLGIGTVSPIQALHVVGQCVTGDTRLRRRRRKSKVQSSKFKSSSIPDSIGDEVQNNEEYIYDEVRIDQVQAGDEIASLDEHTGTIVWSKVNALMDMGIKPIYKLTTASGKSIRTTAEHPYLAKTSTGGIMNIPAGKGDMGPAHLGMASEGHLSEKWDSHRPRRHVAA